MKLLGIVASPRREGNCEILVREALRTVREYNCATELYLTAGKNLQPCLACARCFQEGGCVQQDDMQELYKLMEMADGIIIASPVYFHNVSAQAKIVMDRTFAFLGRHNLKGKVGGAIVTVRRIGGSQTRALIYDYLIAQQMVVAGGAIGYGPNPGDVLTGVGGGINVSALDEARNLGVSMVELMKTLKSPATTAAPEPEEVNEGYRFVPGEQEPPATEVKPEDDEEDDRPPDFKIWQERRARRLEMGLSEDDDEGEVY